jgi:hypothetical protein
MWLALRAARNMSFVAVACYALGVVCVICVSRCVKLMNKRKFCGLPSAAGLLVGDTMGIAAEPGRKKRILKKIQKKKGGSIQKLEFGVAEPR